MLVKEDFVHFPREIAPTLYEQTAEICRSAGFSPQIVQETSEWLTEVSLVEAGLGVAIVPASIGRLKLRGRYIRATSDPDTIYNCSVLSEGKRSTYRASFFTNCSGVCS